MKNFDKPFRSFEDQINILQDRGLIIDDNNIDLVLYALSRIGYYPLINGYHVPFLDEENNYLPNTRFEDIYFQYQLDNALNNICFKYIISIENALKNIISYKIAENFNVENSHSNTKVKSYLHKDYYDRKGPLYVLEQIQDTCLNTKYNPTAYYRNNKNHIPPWVLLKNIPLGKVNLLNKVLPTEIKHGIVDFFIPNKAVDYDLKIKMLNNSLEIIREFRNCIAHGYRLYAFKSKQANSLSKKGIKSLLGSECISNKEYSLDIGKNDFLSFLYSLLLLIPSQPEKQLFVDELSNFKETYNNNPSIYNSFIISSNLPKNFSTRIEQALVFLITNNTLSI